MPSFYRIRDWQDLYENNRTRELKNMCWIPVPVNLSGKGYCTIMEDDNGNRRKEGPSIFGAFVSILEVAAECNPRGDLIDSDREPLSFTSLGKMCRISPQLIERTIVFCVNPLKWIQIIDLATNCEITAQGCGIGAASSSILSSSILSSAILSSSLQDRGSGEGFEKAKFGKRSIIFVPPTIEEFTAYCKENGFEGISEKAYKYYADAVPPWTDKDGKEVRSWKQKLQGVWFKKDENGNNQNRQRAGEGGFRRAGPQSRAGLPGYDANGNAVGAQAKPGEFDEGTITLDGVPSTR